MKRVKGSRAVFENSGHWECFETGAPWRHKPKASRPSRPLNTGREREFSERKQRTKVRRFVPRELFELMESLILA
ncbi:hypothetical protein, partial [Longimicrobium sp.]|uniref:hypothetical protein n=1 Tax=Longimicrobium sp. TaxID=2029185 RepID=UPI002E34CDC3